MKIKGEAINVAPPLLEDVERGFMDPLTLEIGLEIVKAIIGVVIPALTVALSLYAKRANDKLKIKLERKSIKDEIYRLNQLANETQMYKLMNREEKVNTLFTSIQAFVIENDISISEVEIKLLVNQALQSENNLRMRFGLLDEKGVSNDIQ